MKIGIIAANGKAGQKITEEALNRGLDVTVIVRKNNKTQAKKEILKDIFQLTTDDIKDFDVLIDAFGTFTEDTLIQHETTLAHLISILEGHKTRLIVVGGAGSLYLSPDHSLQLANTPDFPDAFKPLATAMAKGLDLLRKSKDVNWTYMSPAADFQADADRLGTYVLAGEEFTVNEAGKSEISYADYAIALIDEAIANKHNKERISVYQK